MTPDLSGAFDLCALGSTRTHNLLIRLIRSSMWIGRARSYQPRRDHRMALLDGVSCCGCCTSLLYRKLFRVRSDVLRRQCISILLVGTRRMLSPMEAECP